VELLSQLSWVDLAIILVLAGGVFAGFTQGMIRYVLNSIAVLIAFVLASQLKGPMTDLLAFWEAFTSETRELIVFFVLFFGFVIAGFFVVRALYHRTRMPVARQIDEIGGAILGLLFAGLVIGFQLVIIDSFLAEGGQLGGFMAGYYDALNESVIVSFFRETIIPTVGYLIRPFVPDEIAQLLTP
jgi:uncharacterized membrane protein required for colicin V production